MGRMSDIVAQCIKRPGHTSVWSKSQRKYVCKKEPGYSQALEEQTPDVMNQHPPITDLFKWALIAAMGGCCGGGRAVSCRAID